MRKVMEIEKSPIPQRESNGSASTTLYLVLHGAIGIFESSSGDYPITIYAPPIREHVYMAGPWLGEQRIPSSLTLQLTGVTAGNDSMANYAMDFVVFQGGAAHPELSCLNIQLPQPAKIYSSLYQTLTPGAVNLVSLLPPGSSPSKITQCVVFEYDMDGGSLVPYLKQIAGDSLETDLQWVAGQNPITGNGSYSLHLYAESDAVELGSDHAVKAFQLTAATLGVSAALSTTRVDPAVGTVPANLAPEEVSYTLASRIAELRTLTKAANSSMPQKSRRFSLPPHGGRRNNNYTCGTVAMIGA
jgi:hypothetical protein